MHNVARTRLTRRASALAYVLVFLFASATAIASTASASQAPGDVPLQAAAQAARSDRGPVAGPPDQGFG